MPSVADIAALFEECCGAEVCSWYRLCISKGKSITITPSRARLRFAGAQIPEEFMVSRLTRLSCKAGPADNGELSWVALTKPAQTFTRVRLTLLRRLSACGEGDIEATLPAARNHAGGLTSDQKRRLEDYAVRCAPFGQRRQSHICLCKSRHLLKLG